MHKPCVYLAGMLIPGEVAGIRSQCNSWVGGGNVLQPNSFTLYSSGFWYHFAVIPFYEFCASQSYCSALCSGLWSFVSVKQHHNQLWSSSNLSQWSEALNPHQLMKRLTMGHLALTTWQSAIPLESLLIHLYLRDDRKQLGKYCPMGSSKQKRRPRALQKWTPRLLYPGIPADKWLQGLVGSQAFGNDKVIKHGCGISRFRLDIQHTPQFH